MAQPLAALHPIVGVIWSDCAGPVVWPKQGWGSEPGEVVVIVVEGGGARTDPSPTLRRGWGPEILRAIPGGPRWRQPPRPRASTLRSSLGFSPLPGTSRLYSTLLVTSSNKRICRTGVRAQGSRVSSPQNTPTGRTALGLALELAHTPPCTARARCQVTRTGCPRPLHSFPPPRCGPPRYSPLTARPGDSPRSWPPGGPPPSRAGPGRLQEGLRPAAAPGAPGLPWAL